MGLYWIWSVQLAGPRSASDTRARGPGFDTRSGHILSFFLPLSQEGQLSYVHEVLVNRLGGLSLPMKSVVRLTDRPDMTILAGDKSWPFFITFLYLVTETFVYMQERYSHSTHTPLIEIIA